MTQAEKHKILKDYKNYHNPRFPASFKWDHEALLGFVEYIADKILKEQNVNELIKYLENKIEECDELSGMKKEKWIFQQVLKYIKEESYSTLDVNENLVHWSYCHNQTCKRFQMYGVSESCLSCKFYFVNKP